MVNALQSVIRVAAGQIEARLMNEAATTLESLRQAIVQAAEQRAELLVLPECAYPAYLIGSVASYRNGDHLSGEEFVAWLAQQAAEYRLHIVCGFIEESGDRLYNAAVLIDDQGREVGRCRKRFLWHAGHDWYTPGESIEVYPTRLGRIGLIICAETRVPEIVATLVHRGADLLAMPTCWVNGARDPGRYQNPQCEFLIDARVREFEVPFVIADKSGMELPPVGYVGRSCIVAGDGTVKAVAPAEGSAVIVSELEFKRPPRLWINEHRRRRLLSPDALAIVPDGGPERSMTVAAVAGEFAEQHFGGQMGEQLFVPLRERGVELLLTNMPNEEVAERLTMLGRAFDIHVVAFPLRTEVHSVGSARVGCVAGRWVRSFAPSRALALDGAEMLLYFDCAEPLSILRTRAVENRVFVLAVGGRSAAIVDPAGRVLQQVEADGAAIARINPAAAGDKCVAPKTDVFAGRRPMTYEF